MLDIKKLEKNDPWLETGLGFADYYKQCLKNRGANSEVIDQALEINKSRKQFVLKADESKAEQNTVGKDIAQLKKTKGDASALIEKMSALKEDTKKYMSEADRVSQELTDLLSGLPNYLHPDTPVGAGEEENQVVKTWGEPKTFGFKAKDHVELGESLGIVDFERASKVTGARFTFLTGMGARLERALMNFMLDMQVRAGFVEMNPPLMVNSGAMFGTSQFPKFKEEQFEVEGTGYYLIPTSEVSVTNYYQDEILSDTDLPAKFCALTPCFRKEAGSHGKDTRGLFRQHQFYKVEMVKFTHPDKSYEEHEHLTRCAENILEKLELPYQRSVLCSGDISFGAAKCFDIEVWLPGQERYREISSCSNFEDFQSRRANIRFRPQGGKPQFVHTLNGSGLAVGRAWIAIMENGQKEDGSISIPKALQPYMGGLTQIKAK